ncbi:hypothetical protein [Lactiplantibacillus plantarum]|uniref:hypothetical protein n=1 Tax=Lactiplantibacillus plantarum TaxID=1590 RepID=UPI0007B54BE3|nr:hypothetical protein [Lactiplantibacillus plantarum]KZT79862.1 hypothetical protein Nizo1838_1652 [Lactiplantibacillus plantarum]KZT91738.1 hypothetical protein Nizo2256_0332 [Lactiplantibacillus plantarum]QRA38778.1 hypothetical protein JMO19_10610 [Lactiplantibacillus plantarum]
MTIKVIDPGEAKWGEKINENFASLAHDGFNVNPITLTGLNGWTLNGSAFSATNGNIQIVEFNFTATSSNEIKAGKLQEVIIGKTGQNCPEWVTSVVGNWTNATIQLFTIENHNEIHLHSMGNLVSAGNALHLHQTVVNAV